MVREIRRHTRRRFSTEEKIRTLRELGIHRSTFYGWYSVPRRRRVSRFRLVTRIAMVPFLGGAVVLSVSRWTSMARR